MSEQSASRPVVRTRVRNRSNNPQSEQERLDAPTRVNRLPQITETEDKGLRLQQEVARTELLMLKGFVSPGQLKVMLDWDTKKCERMIAMVRARWEITGKDRNLSVRRGEQISRLEMLMTEAWTLFQNQAEDPRLQVVTLGSIAGITKQLNDLHGLTPKAISRLMAAAEDRGDLARRMNKQEALAKMAVTLAEIIRKNRAGDDAIDVTPNAS